MSIGSESWEQIEGCGHCTESKRKEQAISIRELANSGYAILNSLWRFL